MPLYKSGLDMWKKFSAKYDPTTVGNRFTQVRDVALDRAQEGLNMVATIRELVRPVLDENGIVGPVRANYLAFATALARHVLRHKGDAATKFANGLKSYYQTTFGLDPSILNEIIQVVVGWAIPY